MFFDLFGDSQAGRQSTAADWNWKEKFDRDKVSKKGTIFLAR